MDNQTDEQKSARFHELVDKGFLGTISDDEKAELADLTVWHREAKEAVYKVMLADTPLTDEEKSLSKRGQCELELLRDTPLELRTEEDWKRHEKLVQDILAYNNGEDAEFRLKWHNQLMWGTYGKDGDQPLEWKPLGALDYTHYQAILRTQSWQFEPPKKQIYLEAILFYMADPKKRVPSCG